MEASGVGAAGAATTMTTTTMRRSSAMVGSSNNNNSSSSGNRLRGTTSGSLHNFVDERARAGSKALSSVKGLLSKTLHHEVKRKGSFDERQPWFFTAESVPDPPPVTTAESLVLPLWMVTVQGIIQIPLREDDRARLSALQPAAADTIMDLVTSLDVFDLEVDSTYVTKAAGVWGVLPLSSVMDRSSRNLNGGDNDGGASEKPIGRKWPFRLRAFSPTPQPTQQPQQQSQAQQTQSREASRSITNGDGILSPDSSHGPKFHDVPVIRKLVETNEKLAECNLHTMLVRDEKEIIGARALCYHLVIEDMSKLHDLVAMGNKEEDTDEDEDEDEDEDTNEIENINIDGSPRKRNELAEGSSNSPRSSLEEDLENGGALLNGDTGVGLEKKYNKKKKYTLMESAFEPGVNGFSIVRRRSIISGQKVALQLSARALMALDSSAAGANLGGGDADDFDVNELKPTEKLYTRTTSYALTYTELSSTRSLLSTVTSSTTSKAVQEVVRIKTHWGILSSKNTKGIQDIDLESLQSGDVFHDAVAEEPKRKCNLRLITSISIVLVVVVALIVILVLQQNSSKSP